MAQPATTTLPAALPANVLPGGHPLPSARTPAVAVRWTLGFLGILCFMIAAIGALVPGMPTTIFLLIGSFLLTKSCPRLEEWMLSTRLFRPYATFIRSREPLSFRVRAAAMAAMWTSILISSGFLFATGLLSPIAGGLMAALGLIGTLAIARFRR